MIDSIFTFEDVQRALLEWPRSFDADEMKAKADDGIIDRLQQVLSQAQRSGSLASVRDLAALLRHALLARSIGKPSAQRVAVPVVGDWPIAAVWREPGVRHCHGAYRPRAHGAHLAAELDDRR